LPPPDRTVLFLQGPPSTWWAELGDALAARGARVLRVNLNAADALFWRRPGALNYRGTLRGWGRWLAALMRAEGVTDVLYYADRLPYHRVALKRARSLGIDAHAVEFGYLRPDWLTLEREGMGAFSHFPDDPARWLADAPAPDMTARYPHAFADEATAEVVYNLTATLGRPLFPRYAPDKYYWPLLDYLIWLPKFLRGPRERRRADKIVADCLRGGWPYALVALQMQSDYQMRACSAFRHQRDMMSTVARSFADHAPAQMRLIFKVHPLDNGWERWGAHARALAATHGLHGRVRVLNGGDLGALIRGSHGVVTINSTVGVHALRALRPVIALGAAVYDAPGLTHRGGLDAFWTAPDAPDPAAVAAFVATLADRFQVKGSFYNREGRRAAAAEMAARIMAGRVGPGPGPLGAPPRAAALAAARRRMREGAR
jgi:capsular polysaccharide export protein